MVLGTLTFIGVTFAAGYAFSLWQRANANQAREDVQQRNQIERLQRRLVKQRSGLFCWYFFTFLTLFVFLVALGAILYATNFFRIRRHFATIVFDWNYWLNYDNFQIFNFNYTGIAAVAVTVVLAVFPLLIILCKLCWDVRNCEKELKETRDKLEQLQQDQRVRGDIAYAQGGWVNIAIANCFNVHCTCYLTVVFPATALAFFSVVTFVCYVLYTYFSK